MYGPGWVQMLVPPLWGCVALSKSLTLFEPQLIFFFFFPVGPIMVLTTEGFWED